MDQETRSLHESEARASEAEIVRGSRRSRATYLEQLSTRVLRTVERTLGKHPAAFARLSALVGELLVELRRSEETCERLRAEIQALGERHADLLERIPIPCLLTDASGTVVEINGEALRLLNASERHTVGKPVVLWFRTRDAASGIVERQASEPRSYHDHLQIVPRERRAREVSVVVQEVVGVDPRLWRWYFLDSEPDESMTGA